MSSGPIEFIDGAGPAQEVPDTEFGGADGLIQPLRGDRLRGDGEASGGHTLEEASVREKMSEGRGIAHRAGMRNGSYVEQVTGVADSEDAVDPVTGRVLPDSMNKLGGGEGELSDLKPG